MSHVRHQKRRLDLDCLQGEIKKLNPPPFDGENGKGDDFEA